MPYLGPAPADSIVDTAGITDDAVTSAKLGGNLVTPGTLDVNGQEFILDADADTSITADTDDTIDIKIAGADDFQFTANTFTAQSGSTIAAQALTATTITTTANPTFANTGNNLEVGMDSAYSTILDAQVGTSEYFVLSTNKSIRFDTSSGSGKMNLAAEGFLSLCEDTNGDMTTGLTVNQGSADNSTIALKSSDIAHGMTDQWETDTYGVLQKYGNTEGGIRLQGLSASGPVSNIIASFAQDGTDTKSTSALAGIMTHSYKKTGTTVTQLGTDENAFCVKSGNVTKFIVDNEGDIHYDGSDAGAFDEYDDAHMIRALDLTHGRGVIDSKFDEFIAYNHEKLAELKLVGREEDDTPNHFINLTGMQRLHNGAIWQQYEKHENLLNAVYELAVEAVGEDKANEILDKNNVKLLSKNELLN